MLCAVFVSPSNQPAPIFTFSRPNLRNYFQPSADFHSILRTLRRVLDPVARNEILSLPRRFEPLRTILGVDIEKVIALDRRG